MNKTQWLLKQSGESTPVAPGEPRALRHRPSNKLARLKPFIKHFKMTDLLRKQRQRVSLSIALVIPQVISITRIVRPPARPKIHRRTNPFQFGIVFFAEKMEANFLATSDRHQKHGMFRVMIHCRIECESLSCHVCFPTDAANVYYLPRRQGTKGTGIEASREVIRPSPVPPPGPTPRALAPLRPTAPSPAGTPPS
jgi:hypothetical protein